MDHKTALQEAVSEIFENMAFQELTPMSKNPLPAQVLWSFRQATMTIYSPIQGTLVMTISPSMMQSVTANVLGMDPVEVDAGMESDVLAEMLNTMAGAWMRKITDVSQPYELGLPDTAEADYIDSKTAEIHCVFNTDSDFIEVAFFLVG